ncbi:MAG: hypothetical protein OES09_16685 [Gammaproteobacteria bacterium]|nr:hypothetical protein [Gammaproteobacteria bacterium]
MLTRYRSVEGYNGLFVDADTDQINVVKATQFVAQVEKYAQARGLEIIAKDQQTNTSSKIRITSLDQEKFLATHYRGGSKIDEITFFSLDAERAQLLVDEMLLLWYPPATAHSRQPVPRYSLEPTSYQVGRNSFFSVVASGAENMTMGHQAWHQLESMTPTFAWEAFPREWDIPSGLGAEDFKQVRYEFRLISTKSAGIVSAEAATMIKAENLESPSYTIAENLPFCRQLLWTMRATFQLNGVQRHTEWGGAYPPLEKPWIVRRNLPRFLAARIPASAYFFTVRTLKSPFAEECIYE